MKSDSCHRKWGNPCYKLTTIRGLLHITIIVLSPFHFISHSHQWLIDVFRNRKHFFTKNCSEMSGRGERAGEDREGSEDRGERLIPSALTGGWSALSLVWMATYNLFFCMGGDGMGVCVWGGAPLLWSAKRCNSQHDSVVIFTVFTVFTVSCVHGSETLSSWVEFRWFIFLRNTSVIRREALK